MNPGPLSNSLVCLLMSYYNFTIAYFTLGSSPLAVMSLGRWLPHGEGRLISTADRQHSNIVSVMSLGRWSTHGEGRLVSTADR